MQAIPVTRIQEVSDALYQCIKQPLAEGKKVLWLISGGSSLPIAANVAQKLQDSDITNLYATLVDDKVTPAALRGTNWEELLDLGFDITEMSAAGIIQPNMPLDALTSAFNALLKIRLDWADISIGQFGIGADYHTGGILPNSPAARENEQFAVGYEYAGEGKLTITPAVIRRLDIAFINSLGASKQEIVKHFLDSEADPIVEPAVNLKFAKETYLYSDVLSEEN